VGDRPALISLHGCEPGRPEPPDIGDPGPKAVVYLQGLCEGAKTPGLADFEYLGYRGDGYRACQPLAVLLVRSIKRTEQNKSAIPVNLKHYGSVRCVREHIQR
jgi:hypothetical protein